MGKVIEGPPEKAKESFDFLCQDAFGTATENNSNFDFYMGGFAGAHLDWKEKLSVQQKADLDSFVAFCKKVPAERTAYDYGYQSGVFIRTIKDLLPITAVKTAAKVIK